MDLRSMLPSINMGKLSHALIPKKGLADKVHMY